MNLSGAELGGLSLRVTDVKCHLGCADLRTADLRKAVLTDVCFDHTTKWGSNSPPASSTCQQGSAIDPSSVTCLPVLLAPST